MRFIILFFIIASPLFAEEPFKKGKWSFEYDTGILFSPIIVHEDLPSFNFWQTNIRIGRMLTSPSKKGSILRGNFEGLLEFSSSSIVEGEGSFIFGLGPIIRYNFVRPKWKLIPYVQAGAGICYTDAYYYEAIGQGFNFTLQTSIGTEYLITKKWAFHIETKYEHISNAGMDERNKGVNAIGVGFGLIYHFF